VPIYDYRCDEGHATEVRHSMEADPLTVCPREGCESPAERQISFAGGVITREGASGPSAASGPRSGRAGPCCGPACQALRN